ncbi:MAG: hypothetical protein H6974_11770 [Gammaproteobacteria bacterium]|nr:hypothetical protein [Gammaproteobacteria bacterium]
MPVKVRLFRFTNPDGSEKDWAYPVETTAASPAFTVFYGRTGSALRQAETPAAQCHDRNPVREAERREGEKRAQGYYALGEFWLADNRRALQRVTPSGVVPASATPPPAPVASSTSAPPAPPHLYWRWRPEPGMDEAAQQARLEAALRPVAKSLAQVGWSLPDVEPDTDHAGLGSRVIAQATGSLALTADHRPLIAFWLLLARACSCVRLADEAGRVITAWPPHLPVDPAILETLGLKPKDLRQLLAATGGDDDWFF